MAWVDPRRSGDLMPVASVRNAGYLKTASLNENLLDNGLLFMQVHVSVSVFFANIYRTHKKVLYMCKIN